MSFWNADLTTRDGAEGAAQNGGAACFVVAILGVIGLALQLMMLSAQGPAMVISAGVAVGVELIVFVIAGFRLRAGKGAIWGIVVAALLVLEMVMKLVTMTGLPGLVVTAIVLIVLVNGIRGAFMLKSGRLDTNDVAAAFE